MEKLSEDNLKKRPWMSQFCHETEDDLLTTLEKQDKPNNFIEKYEREHKIWTLLNQKYYNKDEGGFIDGFNSFYDEWATIFARNTWDSKIFKFDWNKLEDTHKNYHDFEKVGSFFMGKQINTKKDSNGHEEKIEGSEKYTVLDTNGDKIKQLNGYPSFWEDKNMYVEYIKWNNDEKAINFYDENFGIIAKNISEKSTFLMRSNWNILFQKPTEWWNDYKYFIVEEASGKINDKFENEEIFTEYKKEQDIKKTDKESEQKEFNEKPLLFDINFKGWDNSLLVQSISDKNGNVLFEADQEFDYYFKEPYDLTKSWLEWKKNNINKGIFIVSATKEWKYKQDIFINANTGKIIKFEDRPWFTFLDGKVVKHFINNRDADLYNIEGNKLGTSMIYRHNESSFQIITNKEGKHQLVENVTGTIQWNSFDEIRRVYNEENEKIVIVENDTKLQEIHIKK